MDVITHIPAWGNSAQNAASLRKQQLENTVPPVAPANNSLLIDSRVTPDRVRPAAHHNRAQWEVVMGWIFIPTHPAGWRGDVAWRPSDPPRNPSQQTVKGGVCGAHPPPQLSTQRGRHYSFRQTRTQFFLILFSGKVSKLAPTQPSLI